MGFLHSPSIARVKMDLHGNVTKKCEKYRKYISLMKDVFFDEFNKLKNVFRFFESRNIKQTGQHHKEFRCSKPAVKKVMHASIEKYSR